MPLIMQLSKVQVHAKEYNASDCWGALKAFTSARIALGRTGTSVPLKEALAFKLSHAHARDAVYSVLNLEHLHLNLLSFKLPVFHLVSKVKNRTEYLQRPDLGRQMDSELVSELKDFTYGSFDIAIIIADGLSATAVNAHAVPLLNLLIPKLESAGLSLAPICLAEQARVAIGDEVGELLKAKISLILIGERPGLSSTNSLSAYLTFGPKPGLTDEARNCVSNIRTDGLPSGLAADKIFYLIKEALRRKLSGVKLKEQINIIEC